LVFGSFRNAHPRIGAAIVKRQRLRPARSGRAARSAFGRRIIGSQPQWTSGTGVVSIENAVSARRDRAARAGPPFVVRRWCARRARWTRRLHRRKRCPLSRSGLSGGAPETIQCSSAPRKRAAPKPWSTALPAPAFIHRAYPPPPLHVARRTAFRIGVSADARRPSNHFRNQLSGPMSIRLSARPACRPPNVMLLPEPRIDVV